jgi:hypothetical protein
MAVAVILIDTNRFAYKGTWQVRLDFFPVFGSAEGLRPGLLKHPLLLFDNEKINLYLQKAWRGIPVEAHRARIFQIISMASGYEKTEPAFAAFGARAIEDILISCIDFRSLTNLAVTCLDKE